MKTISSYFSELCTKKYRPLGFYRGETTLIRIKEDVIQAFSFRLSQNAQSCSVEFGIFPLCLPQPIFLNAGGYGLDEFFVELHQRNFGWTFDAVSDYSMISCIQSLSEAIDSHLLPFFEKCSNCKSSLEELIRLEEKFDENRKKVLSQRGDSDSAISWKERSLFDSRKYYMALKTNNYLYAKQYLIHQIDFYKERIESFNKSDSPIQPDTVREKFLSRLSLCLDQLERISHGDVTYFDDLLSSNEMQMNDFLAGKYPKVRGNHGKSN